MNFKIIEKTVLGINRYEFEKVLKDVFNKIGEYDEKITWFLCSEEQLYRLKNRFFYPQNISPFYTNSIYGICYPDEKKIYISQEAIIKNFYNNFLNHNIFKFNPFGNMQPTLPFLVAVILDEFTHITTKKDHGDPCYDSTLINYKLRYINKTTHWFLFKGGFIYNMPLSFNNCFISGENWIGISEQ